MSPWTNLTLLTPARVGVALRQGDHVGVVLDAHACAPRLAAAIAMRPSPEPRSTSLSPAFTGAMSSIASTTSSGVGTQMTSLPAWPDCGSNDSFAAGGEPSLPLFWAAPAVPAAAGTPQAPAQAPAARVSKQEPGPSSCCYSSVTVFHSQLELQAPPRRQAAHTSRPALPVRPGVDAERRRPASASRPWAAANLLPRTIASAPEQNSIPLWHHSCHERTRDREGPHPRPRPSRGLPGSRRRADRRGRPPSAREGLAMPLMLSEAESQEPTSGPDSMPMRRHTCRLRPAPASGWPAGWPRSHFTVPG